jgi:hypothetical protein
VRLGAIPAAADADRRLLYSHPGGPLNFAAAQSEHAHTDHTTLAGAQFREAAETALAQILESDQFRRSHRSRLFLQAILQKTLAGDFDSLKERVLGIELFGRDPMFDTDRDAVVRVAANDVRRRLQDYYAAHPESRYTFRCLLATTFQEWKRCRAIIPRAQKLTFKAPRPRLPTTILRWGDSCSPFRTHPTGTTPAHFSRRTNESGTRPGAPKPEAQLADNDLALGWIVEAVSTSPYWDDTAIFVVEDDAQNGPDHYVRSIFSPSSTALRISVV